MGQTEGQTDGRTEGQTDGRTEGRKDVRMEGRTEVKQYTPPPVERGCNNVSIIFDIFSIIVCVNVWNPGPGPH